MQTKQPITMSVADLKDELALLKNDDLLYFGNGDLKFNRMKQRGEKLIACEFEQTYTITSNL